MTVETLVIGGTGKTGRRVAERLKARGAAVRIGSRSATPPFDWDDRSTWAPRRSRHREPAAFPGRRPKPAQRQRAEDPAGCTRLAARC